MAKVGLVAQPPATVISYKNNSLHRLSLTFIHKMTVCHDYLLCVCVCVETFPAAEGVCRLSGPVSEPFY